MKKIANFSLFWKIYLAMLLALFSPIIPMTVIHFVLQSEDNLAPRGIIQHLEWSASELAEQAESVSDELMLSWIADVKEESGLDICVKRGEADFYLRGSERLLSYVPEDGPRPPEQPFVAAAVSSSGRASVTAAMYPFNDRPIGNGRGRIPVPMLVAALLCAVFSFMLVRNFLTPLAELRSITAKLAGGDLSVRVGARVTERSDEFANLGWSFNMMVERIENLVSSQKRLMSDISHEIRSPLQRMEAACALLRMEPERKGEKYIDRLELEIKRINDMVEELLFLTGGGDMDMARPETAELDEIIKSIIQDADFENGGETKKINADIPKLYVLGNPPLLKRAIGNVIQNAIRYTAPEAGIEINARMEEGRVIVVVRDHGQGVAEEELVKIFLPYYRTDKARERSGGGIGLGLAITKRIIENHGGDVAASNAPSGGLIVTMRFPPRKITPGTDAGRRWEALR
ncbi:MAG: HAMP domain-containing protein [Synergistaceae bacterium]|nr:HAMP domain-containing protein [Synergistaceae bacterium]